ncbi:MAG: shikimate dehydrogenase [Actinomycetes bacterium]
MIRAAVLGSPISHSLSPLLHQSAYEILGAQGTYEAIEVEAGQLSNFLKDKDSGWTGFSLTMPLKEEVLAIAHVVDPVAQIISSANTLYRKDNLWLASSTDITGFGFALDSRGFTKAKSAIILGAGATARAVVGALDGRIEEIKIVSRNTGREEAIRKCATKSSITFVPWEYTTPIAQSDLVVNTTPLYGADLFADYLPTKISTLFFEVLYRPWPTVLHSRWRENGGETMDGIDLLVHQAIEQIALFSGKSIDRVSMAQELRKFAVATLE